MTNNNFNNQYMQKPFVDVNFQRTKMMLDKLIEQDKRGYINNEWASNFIWDMKKKTNNGQELTAKQLEKLEEIFEQY